MNAKPRRLKAAALAAGSCLVLLWTSAHAMAASKHLFLIMMENHSTEDIVGNVADAPSSTISF